MSYDEVGAGGVTADGCVAPEWLWSSLTVFGVGDTAYSIAKARRGILEKIVVKVVRAVSSRKTQGARTVLYQDTLNGLWNEFDLVTYDEAIELVHQHAVAIEADRRRLGRC